MTKDTQTGAAAPRLRWIGLRTLAGLAGLVWFGGPAAAQPPAVIVSHQPARGTCGLLYCATLRDCDAATVTFSATGDNCRTDRRLPLTVQLRGLGTRTAVLAVTPMDRSRPYHVDCHYDFMPGTRPTRFPSSYAYGLPYPAGQHFSVDQGFFGTFSHQAGTPDEFAVDLGLPEGTPVLAARPGRVIAVVDGFIAGGVDRAYRDRANYVLIAHDDGTYAGYYHLQRGGARVRVGEWVAQGRQIGLSGATGYASCPHLHFAVYYNPNGSRRRSLPFRFKTPSGIVIPTQGARY